MKSPWSKIVSFAAALTLSTGCLSMGVHHSARPVGDGKMEVGFTTGRPSYVSLATVGTGGLVGGAEGTLRYGMSDRATYTLTAGAGSITNHFDVALVNQQKFHFSVGGGLGLISAGATSSLLGVSAHLNGLGTDINMMVSVGDKKNEFSAGLKLGTILGGAALTSEGTEAAANSEGTGILGGPVLNWSHQGKRFTVVPEIGVYTGRYVADVIVLVLPSISFSAPVK